MNYKETISWLFSQLPMYQRVGKAAYKSDLQTTIDLLREINNPQKKFIAVHIAGTNGKGSVSHLTASILQEAGYKTGLYTSPHLKDFRERIRVNGDMIIENAVTEFVEKHKNIIDKIKPSFFEMTVAMAYEYFANENVDIAVLETGMGGRLDSTNICEPVLTAITNIGFDHMQFLGDSLEKIAAEKAGIIKESVDVVIGRKQNETKPIFLETSNKLNSKLYFSEDEFDLTRIKTLETEYSSFDIWHKNNLFLENISCPLKADYQIENIQTSLSIIQNLVEKKYNINKQNIADGLSNIIKNTNLMGRWQKISDNPLTICDTAHNADGIKAVIHQLKEYNYQNIHMVFGMVNDKNAEIILRLLPKSANYYFCKPNIPRGMEAEILQESAFKLGLNGDIYSSVRDAYNSAKNNCGLNDMIYIGGSTFVVAEIV